VGSLATSHIWARRELSKKITSGHAYNWFGEGDGKNTGDFRKQTKERRQTVKGIASKTAFCTLSIFLLPIFLSSVSGLSAATLEVEFEKTIKSIEQIPYNPRPIATDTADVTGISEAESRTNFLATFSRVTIPAPANGKTFATSHPANARDITLVGYQRFHTGPDASDRPGIILTHGAVGRGTATGSFFVHLANVLFANGYHLLTVDRRDGLLSRCAYLPGTRLPDPTRSHPISIGGSTTEDCDQLGFGFRDPSFTPDTLIADNGAFSYGDILAAAKFLQQQTGTKKIGALGGSRGGLVVIRAAALQGEPGTDFSADLLDAILALSPVADDNTTRFTSASTDFSCFEVRQAEFYSTMVNGSGIRNFNIDPVGAVEDFYALLNSVNVIEDAKVPVLIIQTLTDRDDFTPISGALAYKAKTDRMRLGHTLITTRLGHFSEIWQSDPFWMDQLVLTYFKRLLARQDSRIGEDPGFQSLGPNEDNPLIVDLRFKRRDADNFLSKDSIVPFLRGVCPGLPPP